MTDSEFEVHKLSLKNRYLEKIVGQDEQLHTYWDEITNRRYHFEKQAAKAKLITPLKKEDMINFYEVSSYVGEIFICILIVMQSGCQYFHNN